eukprot:scaffold146042_cov30-Prasinocladus_malaysianus.AAC.1
MHVELPAIETAAHALCFNEAELTTTQRLLNKAARLSFPRIRAHLSEAFKWYDTCPLPSGKLEVLYRYVLQLRQN